MRRPLTIPDRSRADDSCRTNNRRTFRSYLDHRSFDERERRRHNDAGARHVASSCRSATLVSASRATEEDAAFRVIVGGAATREEAEENEKEIQKAAGEDAHTIYDTETKTWGMMIGDNASA